MNLSSGTPGVHLSSQEAFQPAITGVPTALPAFIGYTPVARQNASSLLFTPVMVSSFQEFLQVFGYPATASGPVRQYSPQYYLLPQKKQPATGQFITLHGQGYALAPDPDTVYYLVNSVRLYFMNGGGPAYIVSTGTYGPPSGQGAQPGTPLVNSQVKLNDFLQALDALKQVQEVTLYVCPEATLLSVADNGTLMQSMLLQCSTMQTALAIFDIVGGKSPDPATWQNDIQTFRNNTGSVGLNYGAAYYPFVGTTLMQDGDLDYTNLFGGDIRHLALLLSPADAPDPQVEIILESIEDQPAESSSPTFQQQLENASNAYRMLMMALLADANLLPASGGMAGVFARTDNTSGVWTTPANTNIVGVASLPLYLNDEQQGGLNVDAVSGKSINAIRFFNGQGIVVWGARTLDGNSQDWRYIQIRRTVIYLEQSIKNALQQFVFSPNTTIVWTAVTAMITQFLTEIWAQGGLIGATPSDAFAVQCGLGTTMTSQDVQNGVFRVTIMVAITHPAEFIALTLEQQLASS